MVSLIVHAALAFGTVWLIVRANPAIFRRTATGPLLSGLELALYGIGIASVALGWYFNVTFVVDNTDGWFNNPIWGDGSWQQYIQLMFDNPASSSAGGDFTVANVLILPLVAVVWGRRQGINKPVLFFVVTLFASFTFGWAFFAAALERQRRLALESSTVPSDQHQPVAGTGAIH
ncbi:hypothetical protein ABIE44_002815 [Marmoricola sp. OAE513]|uniref:DUF2834 domain-containing protein n=1 Tax=Marmoricola sp. OAE513 TaxID=2817894 RepID=UPI001AE9FE2A